MELTIEMAWTALVVIAWVISLFWYELRGRLQGIGVLSSLLSFISVIALSVTVLAHHGVAQFLLGLMPQGSEFLRRATVFLLVSGAVSGAFVLFALGVVSYLRGVVAARNYKEVREVCQIPNDQNEVLQ